MSTILSDVVTLLKYARYLPEKGRRENWEEIVARNKAMHQRKFHDNPTVLAELELVYEQVLNRQILPSMRSLQFGGLPIESNNTRMYNCAYLPVSDAECFSESIFLLLSGCGVGYSVQRQHVALLPTLSTPLPKRRYVIADSIEGWADAVKALLNAYLAGAALPEFDYSAIRPAGSLLKTAGGRAPGPEPLRRALEACSALLASKQAGSRLSPLECHDIMCHLAECVVAGGTRRSALLVLFSADDQEMLTAKSGPWWEKNPQRARANNSVALDRETVTHEQFQQLWAAVENSKSGEPGIYFSNNLNEGVNPCCVTGDTWIMTENGPRKAADLLEPVNLIVNGSVRATSGFFATGTKPVVEVLLENGLSVKTTTDHQFLTESGWQAVEKLSVGDRVLISDHRTVKSWGGSGTKEAGRLLGSSDLPLSQTDLIHEASSDFQQGFIEGLFQKADFQGVLEVELEPKLAEVAQLILARFGVISRRESKLSVCGSDLRQFVQCFDVHRSKIQAFIASAWLIQQPFSYPIKSITPLGVEPVYDVTVDGVHEFDGNGIRLHNCEIALKPFQYCNLCEINVNNVSSQQDLNSRVKAAAFLGTLQASYTKFTYLRPIWQITTESEALLGLGMTGIGSGKVLQYDLREAAKVALAENERVAKLIGIRPASRVTTIKPSGCSRGDTLLATSQGLLSLDELRKGDEIWQPLQLQVAVQGGAKPASKFFINGKAATKRITLASGLELESTLNHRYMVAEQGVSQWRRVDEIKLGDLLPYELNFNQTDSDPTFPFEEKIVQLDHILAWLCGVYFALGSFPEEASVSNTLQSYFDTTQISGQELRFFQHYSQSLDAFLKCKPFTLKRFIDGCYYGRSTVSLASKQLAQQFLIAKRSVGYDGWIQADGDQWLVGSLVGDGLEKVVSIEDSECETFDIEVPELHAYLANSVVSHNTSSLLLGCSSGIHPWYAPHYIRRIRVSKREPFYAFFKQRCPQLIEDDLFNENDAVVSFPVSAPEGSIFRQESPIELLQRVHRFNTEWIATGHRKGDNRHNVSATISIKPEEWQAVGHWMWENRCDFNGLSVLDYDLGTYKQAPHEECSKEKIDEMLKYLEGFDLAELVEEADLTDFMGEAACSGDKCERKK